MSDYVENLFGSWIKQTVKKKIWHLLDSWIGYFMILRKCYFTCDNSYFKSPYLLDIYTKIFSDEMVWHDISFKII